MNHSKIIQEILGISHRPDLYSNEEVFKIATATGWGATMENNFNNCINIYKQLTEALAQNNAEVKISPIYTLYIADIGDMNGCYIWPQDVIVLNIWQVLHAPMDVMNHCIPHEIAHWYAANAKNCFHHGEVFAECFNFLFGRAEIPCKWKPRDQIIESIKKQTLKMAELQMNIED